MSEKKSQINENGYLYSMWNDRFTVYEGRIEGTIVIAVDPLTEEERVIRDYARFRSTDPRAKSYQCSVYEGVVFNKTVWLSERNDQKAKEIFLQYEESKIKELEDLIESHKKFIEVLKEN